MYGMAVMQCDILHVDDDSGTAEEPSAPVPFPGSTLYAMSKTNASAFSGKVQTFRPHFLHYVQRRKKFFLTAPRQRQTNVIPRFSSSIFHETPKDSSLLPVS